MGATDACAFPYDGRRLAPRWARSERAVSAHAALATLPSLCPSVHLGRTGLVASRVGLGFAALGRPAYMALGRDADLGADRSVSAMARRCHALLDAAYAMGIRYIDVARSYGLAEHFVKRWCDLRNLSN